MKSKVIILFMFCTFQSLNLPLTNNLKASKPNISSTISKKLLNETIDVTPKASLDDYHVGSQATINFDGPGPIVSNKWQYIYTITQIKETGTNEFHDIIVEHTNNTSVSKSYNGVRYTLPTPSITPDLANLNVPGVNNEPRCKEKFLYLTPYGVAGGAATSEMTPSVTVAPYSKYVFAISTITATFSVHAIKRSMYWAWGSWSDWNVEEQKVVSFYVTFYETHIVTTPLN